MRDYAKTAARIGGWKELKMIGGAEGDRTPDLRIANAALCQTELLPHSAENTVSSFEFQVSGKTEVRLFVNCRLPGLHLLV
jgi:hypothetical protein